MRSVFWCPKNAFLIHEFLSTANDAPLFFAAIQAEVVPLIRARSSPQMIDLKNYTTSGFDRGATRLKEALWHVAKAMFFSNPLPLPSGLRARVLRLFGAR